MLFGRSGSYNYSAIHVQVNSIPKGVTTHVKNKRSDFNRGYFFGDTLYSQLLNLVWNCIDTGHKMFLECFIYRHLPRGAI